MRMQWGWIGIVAAVMALANSNRPAGAQYSPYANPGAPGGFAPGYPGPGYPAPGYPGAAGMGAPMMGGPMAGGPMAGGPMPGAVQQTGPRSYAMYAPGGVAQAAYDPSAGGPMPGQAVPYTGGAEYGSPYDAGYGGEMYGDGMSGGEMYGDEMYGDGMGYGPEGVLRQALRQLLPYSEGGACAPRWFDFHAEGMYLTRENVSRTVNFTSDGPAGVNPPVILMSSNNIAFDDEPGLRFTAAMQLFNQYNFEMTYFGLFNWSGQSQLDNAFNDLYSPFSNFGAAPGNLAFDETDNASTHRIEYSSSFDNFELNVRKRWTGVNCRLQGSTLMGARYFWLEEDFRFFTLNRDQTNPNQATNFRGTMTSDTSTSNSLTGFQIGGDLWTVIVPGISIGGEMKAAVMGNHASQSTQIFSSTTNPLLGNIYTEKATANELAGLVEANVMGLYRIGPNWTLRSGYNFLYVDGIALAIENFNGTPPNTFANTGGLIRTPRINHNGDAFYHGFTFGAEYMW